MTICLVTDRRLLSPEARTVRDEVAALSRWFDTLVRAGIDLIQLRERDLPARLLTDLVRAAMQVSAGTSTRVVVNDRADVAVAGASDGVHLRGDSPSVSSVRSVLNVDGATRVVGRSVHSVQESRDHADADYLVFGAVFDSGPKPGLGVDALRDAVTAFRAGHRAERSASPTGVIAIGGLTVPRAAACMAAGATGVAAIRLFLPAGRAAGALGPEAAVQQLREVV